MVSHFNRKILFLTVSIAALMGSAPTYARAAADEGRTATEASVADIVVTAQRRSESLSRTPVAVSVLTSEVLAQKAVRSESDLQIAVPGLLVRATEDSNQLNYAIRGQTIDAFTSSQPAVQAYVNEVPVTNGSASAFYDLESVQVLKGPQGTLFGKNVTGGAVLFTTVKPTKELGGYLMGTLGNYGRRAVQGAINLPIVGDAVLLRIAGDVERRNGFVHDFLSGQRYGDVKREAFRATLIVQPIESLTNTTVVEYSHVGGTSTPGAIYSVYAPGSTNNGQPLFSTTSVLYSPLLDTIAGPGAYAAYVAAHPGADPNGLVSYLAAQKARGPYQVALTRYPLNHQHGLLVTNTTAYDLAEDTQIKNIFGYYKTNLHKAVDEDGTIFGIENVGAPGTRRINRSLTEEAQILGKALNGKLSYVVGVYYDSQKNYDLTTIDFFDLSPIIPKTGGVYISNLKFKSLAGYGQGTYDLSDVTGVDGLGVTAGARYTSVKIKFEALPGSALFNFPGTSNEVSSKVNRVSWQFGLQEQAGPVLFYGVTRRSFRSGGFNIFAPQRPGTAEVGGNEFKPESATDVEGGVKFSGRIGQAPARVNLAVYKQWVDDIQRAVYVTLPIFGLSGFTANIPQAQIYGAELDGSINPAPWLELGGSVAYTHARFSKPVASLFGTVNTFGPYPDTPKWSGSAFAQVSVPLGESIGTLRLRGDVFGQTKIYFSSLNDTNTPGTELPGYALANLRVSVDDIAKSGVSIAAYVKNVFDKLYYVGGLPTGNVLSLNTAIPGERRTFFVEAKVKF